MAVRNTNLPGGTTDWGNEEVTAADLNDTFDAAVELIQTTPCFWLNDELYDVYDDFDSYSTGSFTTNTNWTVTDDTVGSDYGTHTITIENTQLAGGTTNELQLYAYNDNTGTSDDLDLNVTSKILGDNKHTFGGIYISKSWRTIGAGPLVQISIDGTNYYDIVVVEYAYDDFELNTNFLVVALGSNNYDLYLGRKKVQSNVNISDLEVTFRIYADTTDAPGAAAWIKMCIDDIRQAKTATS